MGKYILRLLRLIEIETLVVNVVSVEGILVGFGFF